MFEENARELAYAVLFQAVKDYVSGNYDRTLILKHLRQMGNVGNITADRLEFHLEEVVENLSKKDLFTEAV